MNERQKKIIEMLDEQGEVSISTLAKYLNVSEMTIHRDLNDLDEKGLLRKKRGGAVFIEATPETIKDPYIEHKQAIAKEAAKLIQSGDSIIFDNSTTAFEVAKVLDKSAKLNIFTTNLSVSNVVKDYPNVTLYCSGGLYLKASTGFVGKFCEHFLSSIHATKAVIGTSGISTKHGLTSPYPMHAALERIIINKAETVIVVADHTKFNKVAIEKAGDISDIDYIITDSVVDEEIYKEMSTISKFIIAKV